MVAQPVVRILDYSEIAAGVNHFSVGTARAAQGKVLERVTIESDVGPGMGIEFLPATIAPEGFQAQQSFIARRGPELAGAFEAALVLAASGLNGARTQRLIGEFDLLSRGGAGLHG